MSMRGEIISGEYQRMVWVKDESGKQFVCYAEDLRSLDSLSDEEKKHCLDESQVLGPNW